MYSAQSSSFPLFRTPIYHEAQGKNTPIPLPELRHLMESRLQDVIASEGEAPSYRRARLSNGGIKEEGILRHAYRIHPEEAAELKALTTAALSDQPDAYIEFLERVAKVELAANQQINRVVPIRDYIPLSDLSHCSSNALFFPYNGEGVSDYGWGCCFRATQTALSVAALKGKLGEIPTFETLFHLFGTNDVLNKIYLDFLMNRKGLDQSEAIAQTESVFKDSSFSPYQHPYGWSNPFVSQLMFHYYGIDSHMVTVNGIPASLQERKIGRELLNAELDFPSLAKKLVTHFEQPNSMPVVADDGKFAMAIVGAKQTEENTTIWFADPHIKGGANNPETPLLYDEDNPAASFQHAPDEMAGIYSITFDHQGRQIDCSQKRHEVMFSRRSYEETEFFNKPWMFTFPA